MSEVVDRVIVSTDSPQYAAISNKYGAETPFLRPPEISGKYSTDYEFMEHAIHWFKDHEQLLPEYWIHLRPTSPLRDPSTINKAVELLKHRPDIDCLKSVQPTTECPYKWFNLDENGLLQTICHISLDEANGPRQQYPPVYIPNGYVDVLKTETILNTHSLYGSKALPFITDPITDIDYMSELEKVSRDAATHDNPVIQELTSGKYM